MPSPSENTSYEWHDEPLSQVIGEAIGAASVCWLPRGGKRVFNTDEAAKIVDAVMYYLAERDTKLREQILTLETVPSLYDGIPILPDPATIQGVVALFDGRA